MMEEAHLVQYMCEACSKMYMSKRAVQRHLKDCHNVRTSEMESGGPVLCREEGCTVSFSKIDHLRDHLHEVHNFVFKIENYEFSTYEEFSSWKQEFERKNIVAFSKSNGRKKKLHYWSDYYYCSRSGELRASGTGKRRSRESSKIGGHCTATMTVTTNTLDKSVTVSLCNEHYNHERSLKYLRLPKSSRKVTSSLDDSNEPSELDDSYEPSSLDDSNEPASLDNSNEPAAEHEQQRISDKINDIRTAFDAMLNILPSCDDHVVSQVQQNINETLAFVCAVSAGALSSSSELVPSLSINSNIKNGLPPRIQIVNLSL